MRTHRNNLVCVCVFIVLASLAHGEVPGLISYQGQLNDDSGVPVNSTVSFVFRIYDVETGGAALWSENQTIPVSNGLFSVQLGGGTALPGSIFSHDKIFLGITVGADEEMTPRQNFTSSAFSQRSVASEKLSFQDNLLIGKTGVLFIHVPVVGLGNAVSVRLYVFGKVTGATPGSSNHGVSRHYHGQVQLHHMTSGNAIQGYSSGYTPLSTAIRVSGGDSSGGAIIGNSSYSTSVSFEAVPQGVEIWIDGVEYTASIGDPNTQGGSMYDSSANHWGVDGATEWNTGALDLTLLIDWVPGDHYIEIKETGGTGGNLIYTLLVNY